jgi:hypothetical protein
MGCCGQEIDVQRKGMGDKFLTLAQHLFLSLDQISQQTEEILTPVVMLEPTLL